MEFGASAVASAVGFVRFSMLQLFLFALLIGSLRLSLKLS